MFTLINKNGKVSGFGITSKEREDILKAWDSILKAEVGMQKFAELYMPNDKPEPYIGQYMVKMWFGSETIDLGVEFLSKCDNHCIVIEYGDGGYVVFDGHNPSTLAIHLKKLEDKMLADGLRTFFDNKIAGFADSPKSEASKPEAEEE